MKIVLVIVRENFTPVPPLGLLYVGTMLKKDGHHVKIFDVNIKEKDEFIRKIRKIDPDLIGFSVMTTAYSITKEFNRDLRKEVPNAYYCWGGVHASAMPIETIKENKLDFLVYGESDFSMVEICRKITGKKKDPKKQGINLESVNGVYYVDNLEIKKTPHRGYIENLDSIPIPDRSLLENFKWYLSPPGILRGKFYYGITTMWASRGCPYQCIFCASNVIQGPKIRRRSVAGVINEMRYLKNNFGVIGVYFLDDTFATDTGWLKEFCSSLKKSNLNMIWGCQTRANIAQDINVLMLMKEGGCVQVDIGCESGSDKILKNLRKGITTKMIIKSFKNLKQLKINTFATFIIGNPGETMEDVKKTEILAKSAPGIVSFLTLVPYPGSPLYKMALEKGWFVDDNVVFDERWANKQSDMPVMEASFKAEELVKIRAKLLNKFFFKNNRYLILPFIRNPYFLYKLIKTVVVHPLFIYNSAKKAFKKRKALDLLEDIYQKFNEELRK